ncbi:MAG TPA: hypothetical protein VGR35_15545 [Tepidisphaeraceae bacterium]|nr:hypothetical protein [Tepidisphaeraceae bacterium]
MTTTSVTRRRTGEKCDISGRYDFDGYLNGTRYPEPRPEEKRIPAAKNNVFPPIRSTGKGCYWRLVERI